MIDRKRTHKAVAGLSQAVQAVQKKGVSIWIFPEGTRNRGTGLLPFKKGAFHMAVQAGVPIVPMVGEPLSPFVDWKKKTMKGGTYRIKILPPIKTQGLSENEVEKLANDVRNKMLEALESFVPKKAPTKEALLGLMGSKSGN